MGEARTKRQLREVELRIVKQIDSAVDLARVSSAIRKLAEAASSHVGADCYLHADLCRELLKQHGVESRLVIGFAAWRVGDGHGDVIVHAPLQGMAPQPEALPFHAWLEIGPAESAHRLILDFSTYQLRRKAAELDALDGGDTNVNWCPDYLAALATDVSSLEDVTMKRRGCSSTGRTATCNDMSSTRRAPSIRWTLITSSCSIEIPTFRLSGRTTSRISSL